MLAHVLSPLRWLQRRIHRAKRKVSFRVQYTRRSHRGVTLWMEYLAPKGAAAALGDAVDLIARADPVSFGRLPKLLPGGIAAAPTNQSLAWYDRSSQRCYIGANALKHGTATDLALYIIHEMAHARLARFNSQSDFALRIREEKTCLRRELAFARKLQALGYATASYRAKEIRAFLDDFPAHEYSDAHRLARDRRTMLEQLRLLNRLDTPRWLRRITILRLRRRMRAHRSANTKLQTGQ